MAEGKIRAIGVWNHKYKHPSEQRKPLNKMMFFLSNTSGQNAQNVNLLLIFKPPQKTSARALKSERVEA